MICHTFMQVCAVGASLWLKYWTSQSNKDDEGDALSLKFFLLVFAFLTLIYILSGMALAWISYGIAAIRASESLHRKFVSKIMLFPPAFFDVTP